MSAGHHPGFSRRASDSGVAHHDSLLRLWDGSTEDTEGPGAHLLDPSGAFSVQSISALAWPPPGQDETNNQGWGGDASSSWFAEARVSPANADQPAPINAVASSSFLHPSTTTSETSIFSTHPSALSLWPAGSNFASTQIYSEEPSHVVVPARTRSWAGTSCAGASAPNLNTATQYPQPPLSTGGSVKMMVSRIVRSDR